MSILFLIFPRSNAIARETSKAAIRGADGFRNDAKRGLQFASKAVIRGASEFGTDASHAVMRGAHKFRNEASRGLDVSAAVAVAAGKTAGRAIKNGFQKIRHRHHNHDGDREHNHHHDSHRHLQRHDNFPAYHHQIALRNSHTYPAAPADQFDHHHHHSHRHHHHVHHDDNRDFSDANVYDNQDEYYQPERSHGSLRRKYQDVSLDHGRFKSYKQQAVFFFSIFVHEFMKSKKKEKKLWNFTVK